VYNLLICMPHGRPKNIFAYSSVGHTGIVLTGLMCLGYFVLMYHF